MAEPPDVEAMDGARQALSSVMLAAAFVIDPGVWPAFAAFVERNTSGKQLVAGPEVMDDAIQITDALRRGMASAAGRDPGTPYPPRWGDG
jgi:hypothetical protein